MTNSAERLREARIKAGYESATAAAKAFGWTVSSYLGHENGSRGLQVDSAQRYAKAFKVDWTYLMGVAGDAPGQPGIPVTGTLGYVASGATGEAVNVLASIEGFNAEELVAFSHRDRFSTEYLIVFPVEFEDLLIGDEVVTSHAEGSGRYTRCYFFLRREDGEEGFFPSRPVEGVGEWLSPEGLATMPGLKIEGVVVGVLEDRHRRRTIEAKAYTKRIDRAMRSA